MKNRMITICSVFLTLILAGHGGEKTFSGRQFRSQIPICMDSCATVSSPMKIDADFGKMPLYFVPNQGQMDNQVAYYVQGKDKTIYFTDEGITLALHRAVERDEAREITNPGELGRTTQQNKLRRQDGDHLPSRDNGAQRWTVKLDFIGANPDIQPVGKDDTGALISYFKGNQEDWLTGLPTYSKIVYPNLWPGIDLVYYGTVNKLKYEFIVYPGADPAKIRLAYRGVESLKIDPSGRLQVTTPFGGFSDDIPVAYQEVNGKRNKVTLSYMMYTYREAERVDEFIGENQEISSDVYGFDVGAFDHAEILVLDPAVLVYCGFIGGSYNDSGEDIAVDSSGNAYVIGETNSTEATFPATEGPDLTQNGNLDVFVAKVAASGTALSYCGYIGGSDHDYGLGIAVDGSGNAYLAGGTKSYQFTFPVVGGPDLIHNGGMDAFVAKVNAFGTGLVYCGYIGGYLDEYGQGIAVDGSGSVYVSGNSASPDLPVTGGPDLTFNGGGSDAFVAKVSTAGTALIYCGYIGGSDNDGALAIAVDSSGSAYVSGRTGSAQTTFPVSGGPDLIYNGGGDAFVAKVNVAGTALVYCGYVGGSGDEYGWGIAADGLGNAYVTGRTYSTETSFPVVGGPDLTFNGGYEDAFVAKINAAGTALVYCGYVGGSGDEQGRAIALDRSGNAYIAGWTKSTQTTFPVIIGPDLTFNGGSYDAFVAKVNAAGTALVYCGYIGGSSFEMEYGWGIAVDGSGNAYVTGWTYSTEASFPTVVGPDMTQNGAEDAFVAKVYFFEQPVHKHAVGDFEGDGIDEFAIDFGASGAWLWNGGTWSQLATDNPENMLAFNIDGNSDDEIAADLGALGLWMWNGGVWSQLSANDPEYLIAADTNNNGIDELIIDLGAGGLKWRQEDGYMFGMTGMDPQNIITADTDHDDGDEVVADFGTMGMWVCDVGNWSQLTSADPNATAAVDTNGLGNQGVASGLGGLGVWLWDSGTWSQLSGVYSDRLISGRMVVGGGEEIAGDFGLLGLWMWSSSIWTQMSGVNPDDMAAADTDGNGIDEVAGDFAILGLWLWDSGSWTQLSGVNPEGLLEGDIDGDGGKELIVDFGSLGVWLWNGGTWSQISSLNPD